MSQCFISNSTASTFEDARATCQALGGTSDLVMYSSGEEQQHTSCDGHSMYVHMAYHLVASIWPTTLWPASFRHIFLHGGLPCWWPTATR
jgi:hypothetical protein